MVQATGTICTTLINITKHITKLRGQATENKKILENYFFMTLLLALNMCFHVLIYPYLIRRLGVEEYGLYAYALSLVTIFITWTNFGFDMPAAKLVAQHADDKDVLSRLLSTVLFSKFLLWLIGTAVFMTLVFTIPMMKARWDIYVIIYLQTIMWILFPQWYYQGLQRMKIVTYIQLGFRLLSLPMIFIFVRTPQDLQIFATITMVTTWLGAFTAVALIRWQDGIILRWTSRKEIGSAIREAMPFFATNATGIIKEQGVVLLIGSMLSMTDVAIYDLANKIIIIPRTIISKINDSIYPDMMIHRTGERVLQILQSERILGLISILFIILFGPVAVWILGGVQMMTAYWVSILLSVTILCYLIVGAYIQFCFIPFGKKQFILQNQIIAMTICLGVTTIGLIYTHSVFAPALGIALAGIGEMMYCRTMVNKYQLITSPVQE